MTARYGFGWPDVRQMYGEFLELPPVFSAPVVTETPCAYCRSPVQKHSFSCKSCGAPLTLEAEK